jgi:hypothetical protein
MRCSLNPALPRGRAGQGRSLDIAMTARSAQYKVLSILAALYYFGRLRAKGASHAVDCGPGSPPSIAEAMFILTQRNYNRAIDETTTQRSGSMPHTRSDSTPEVLPPSASAKSIARSKTTTKRSTSIPSLRSLLTIGPLRGRSPGRSDKAIGTIAASLRRLEPTPTGTRRSGNSRSGNSRLSGRRAYEECATAMTAGALANAAAFRNRGFLHTRGRRYDRAIRTSTKRSGSIQLQRRRLPAAPTRSDSSNNMTGPLRTTAKPSRCSLMRGARARSGRR